MTLPRRLTLAGAGAAAIEFPAANQYTIQGDLFSAAVRGRGTVPVSLEDALANMAVIDALFRSAETRRWEVPEGGRVRAGEDG